MRAVGVMIKRKVDWKAIVWVNIFFILYTIIDTFWMDYLYKNDNLINIYTTLGVAIFLILPYAYINSRVELGRWYILFLIPFIPYLVYQMLLSPIWYKIFSNPYKNDDLGVGLLSLMIGFLHWLSIVIAIFLGYVVKGYRTSKI